MGIKINLLKSILIQVRNLIINNFNVMKMIFKLDFHNMPGHGNNPMNGGIPNQDF
jgi:hypothetical protein